MAPNAGGDATGAISDAINAKFGSFEEFKKAFSAKAELILVQVGLG